MNVLATLKKLWSGQVEGIAAGAALVSLAALFADVLGVVRDRLLATHFGAGNELDVYYAAFRFPDFLYNLLIVGALSAGFIPLFTELREREDLSAALRFAGQVLSLVVAVLLIAGLVGLVAAPWIVPLLVPGFSPDKQELTTTLTRIMFLSPLCLGISAVMGGVLQSTKRFFAFAFAPIFYNLGIIFGIVVLAPICGSSGLAWGVVCGAFLHGFVQYLAVRPLGRLPLAWPSFRAEPVRRLCRLMIPRTAGLAVVQANLVIILFFASSVGDGAVSIFTLAGNLQSFPFSLVGISFAIAAFPVLAQAVGAKRHDKFEEAFVNATRQILFFILPFCVLFLLERAQIVRVVFGDGRFNWEDTQATLRVFAILTLALPAQALCQLVVRAFYALQETWTPFFIACASELTTALVAWMTYRSYGINGLAWAVVIGSCVNLILLLGLLRRKVTFRLLSASFMRFLVSLAFALLAQAVVTFVVKLLLGTLLAPLAYVWTVFLQGAIAGITGAIAFILIIKVTRVSEFELLLALKQRLLQRFRLKKP